MGRATYNNKSPESIIENSMNMNRVPRFEYLKRGQKRLFLQIEVITDLVFHEFGTFKIFTDLFRVKSHFLWLVPSKPTRLKQRHPILAPWYIGIDHNNVANYVNRGEIDGKYRAVYSKEVSSKNESD